MMTTMLYNKGDIVLIPFPFADGAGHKKRPALVISGLPHHAKYGKHVCLAITSKAANPKVDRYEFRVTDPKKHGLIHEPSWVLVDKAFSIDEDYIHRKLGEISNSDLFEIESMFNRMFI